MNVRMLGFTAAAASLGVVAFAQDPESPIMLAGEWVPKDPHQIDYEKLPRVPADHAIISDVRDQAGTRGASARIFGAP